MKYCTQCGTELIVVIKPAHKLECMISIMDVGLLGTKYNPETGHRQYGRQIRCPRYKWWRLDNHVCYTDEESLHDSNLPELL